MASLRKRGRYTCREVLDMIVNDSDSEGPAMESDSEISQTSSGANDLPSGRSSSSTSDISGVFFLSFSKRK